jgi:hypothetical protein
VALREFVQGMAGWKIIVISTQSKTRSFLLSKERDKV